jgi:hypothetical protein
MRSRSVRRMHRSLRRIATVALLAALPGLALATSAGAAPVPASPPVPAAAPLVAGVGSTTLDERFGADEGDRVTFAVAAHVSHGRTTGHVDFLHLERDGSLYAYGDVDVSCLRVDGDDVTLTGRITDVHIFGGTMPPNMGIAMKIGDHGRSDEILWSWVPMDQLTPCLDLDRYPVARLPVEHGGYVARG